ncbi:alpha/beta-hydrolase [Mytilinidion resinicola]|uniref:Alpha/beta-hydrolase n=1 Tax=Mytilinidion resinicola TaxID=574789 RepID=A0A6A6YM77_9PEZI|nr:alpha/beta-hydrolase [Mytilinidion resinicola]KAF2809638.1 alpha/beta-hydrolase [Mytilinidion resinicola]
MLPIILSSLLSLPLLTTAIPHPNPQSPNCIPLTLSISLTAPSYPLLLPAIKNGYDATSLLLAFTGRDASSDPSALLGPPTNITVPLSISALYCTPTTHYNPQKAPKLQLLTHGLGFDKTYWNFGAPKTTYNYIAAATAAGYATFSYDRIGTGLSSVEDPYNVVQTPVELALLTHFTEQLKAGTLSHLIPKPSKLVHVGHSFGSILSNALIATRPELSDGVVLTGFSHNTTFEILFQISTGFHLASENQPARFGKRSSGYLTWGDKYANQYSFLKYPNFEPAVLEDAEANKFPFTVGEFITFGKVPYAAPEFKKPILMIDGDSDLIFCGADCTGILDGPYSVSPQLFANAEPLAFYLQPDTGHGMNLHGNATGWFAVVNDFLDKHV